MTATNDSTLKDYFRHDQRDGVSPPDPSKICTYAEHIVRARGKRTNHTSVSLDPDKIRDFGDSLYKLRQAETLRDGHRLVKHDELLNDLRRVIREEDKAERARAIQALRYATARKEALVSWAFEISNVSRKDMITWATNKVQPYFVRV